eukprot:TRINITY_DN44737_c0_g1_i1.p1 TRINITY_DN44737_c0_g1~~TRINITY_DN44737_c0_g1_i1.p1  ORF type:complete len:227 (+),score=49.70 TRINITY_DN44737_c0_g1_i1:110-790(+)
MAQAVPFPAGVPDIPRRVRTSVKASGRSDAKADLRARCLARVREGRAELLARARELTSESGGRCVSQGILRGVAREIILAEDEEDSSLDMEELIAFEEALIKEFEEDLLNRDILEVERQIGEEAAHDAALFEQHLLGGVPCPLCDVGRLNMHESGELRCTSCPEMRAAVMDETMPMEDVSELIGSAEEKHRRAGCSARPLFEVTFDYGVPMLFLACRDCGWREVAL